MTSKWVKVRLALGLSRCGYAPRTMEEEGASRSLDDAGEGTNLTSPSPGRASSMTPTPSSSGLRFSRSAFRSSRKICSICLATMQPGKGHALFTAECSHMFHFHCIAANVKHGNHVCPICRAKWKDVPFQAPLPCDLSQVRPGRINPVNWAQEDDVLTVLRRLPRANSHSNQQQPANIFRSVEPNSFADDEPLAQQIDPVDSTNRHVNEVDVKVFPELSAIQKSCINENFAVLIHLKAPVPSSLQGHGENQPTSQTSRAPVDLVTVLDISGSMSGTKLALLKRAMGFVIQNLGSSDRLSVIAFSSTARRLFHLRCMTETGRQQALQAVNSLICNGGTNIAAGLRKGAKVLDERREKNPVCSIMLLSDGQDTYRMCPGGAHPSQSDFNKLLPHSIRGGAAHQTPVHAFGFGSDHDAASMHSISETSGGTFSFIEAEDAIQDAFAQCIGGLLSVVVQKLLVSVECVDSCVHIEAIKSGSYTCLLAEDKRSGSINVGDLYAEEERDFLVFTNVPDAYGCEETILLKIGGVYTDPVTKGSISFPAQELRIQRPDVLSPYPPSREVDRQRNRHMATEAMVEAKASAERGELSEAILILEKCRQSIMKSISGQSGDDLSVLLDAEMREMQERMSSRQRYEASGRAYVLSGLSSHSWQRATARGESMSSTSLVQAYQTTSMVNMLHRSQTISPQGRGSKPPIRSSLSFPARRASR